MGIFAVIKAMVSAFFRFWRPPGEHLENGLEKNTVFGQVTRILGPILELILVTFPACGAYFPDFSVVEFSHRFQDRFLEDLG